MTLQTNTIDPDAVVLQELNDVLACEGGFVAWALDAVVVVVEFCSWVCCGGGSEGDLDVFGTQDGEKGVVAVGAIVVEGFVQNIPGVALAGPVAGFLRYVIY